MQVVTKHMVRASQFEKKNPPLIADTTVNQVQVDKYRQVSFWVLLFVAIHLLTVFFSRMHLMVRLAEARRNISAPEPDSNFRRTVHSRRPGQACLHPQEGMWKSASRSRHHMVVGFACFILKVEQWI